jgi:hypothetical protein
MKLFFLIVLLVLISCVPRATPISFDLVGDRRSNDLQAEFQAVLKTMKINVNGGKAYRYVGTDERAFLVAADQFYRENPGFCPLFENAFQYIRDRSIFMTIAAKGLEVRLFVYDRSDLPRFEFAYFQGVAKEKLAVSPCRTAGLIPSKRND